MYFLSNKVNVQLPYFFSIASYVWSFAFLFFTTDGRQAFILERHFGILKNIILSLRDRRHIFPAPLLTSFRCLQQTWGLHFQQQIIDQANFYRACMAQWIEKTVITMMIALDPKTTVRVLWDHNIGIHFKARARHQTVSLSLAYCLNKRE